MTTGMNRAMGITMKRLAETEIWYSAGNQGIHITHMSDQHIMNTIIWLYNNRESLITRLQIDIIAYNDIVIEKPVRSLLGQKVDMNLPLDEILAKGAEIHVLASLSLVDPAEWIIQQPIWIALSKELDRRNKFEAFEYVLRQVINDYSDRTKEEKKED